MSKHNNKQSLERRSLLEDRIEYSGSRHKETDISLLKFNVSSHDLKKDVDDENLLGQFKEGYNNWAIVSGLSDNAAISKVLSRFDLHTVDVKGILEIANHSAISEYDDKIVFRANALSFNEEQKLHEEQISFILGRNYLVSFTEGNTLIFNETIEAISDSNPKLRSRGVDYLLIVLLDQIVLNYQNVIDRIEKNLDEYTEIVVAANENESLLVGMLDDRKSYVKIKHTLFSLKDVITKLQRCSNGIISPETMVYVDDLVQQLMFIGQDVESCDQAFNSIVNLHFNNDNKKMNDIMKRLTVISTIFLPMTFLVGLWGMNFSNMPETQLQYGYFLACLVIFTTAFMSWYYLKKKNWL